MSRNDRLSRLDRTNQSGSEDIIAELRAANEKLKSKVAELETKNEDLQTKNEDLQTKNEDLQTKNEDLQTKNATQASEITTLSDRIDVNLIPVLVREAILGINKILKLTQADEDLLTHIQGVLTSDLTFKQIVIGVFAVLEIDSGVVSNTTILSYLCLIIRPNNFHKTADLETIKSINRNQVPSAAENLSAILKHIVPAGKAITLENAERIVVGLRQDKIYARLYLNAQRPAIEHQTPVDIANVCYSVPEPAFNDHCRVHDISADDIKDALSKLKNEITTYKDLSQPLQHTISDIYGSTTVHAIKVGMLGRHSEIVDRDNEHIKDMTDTATKLSIDDQAWLMRNEDDLVAVPNVNEKGFVVSVSNETYAFKYINVTVTDKGGKPTLRLAPAEYILAEDTFEQAVERHISHYNKYKDNYKLTTRIKVTEDERLRHFIFGTYKPNTYTIAFESTLKLPTIRNGSKASEAPTRYLSFDGKTPALFIQYASRAGVEIHLPVCTSPEETHEAVYRPIIYLNEECKFNVFNPYTAFVEPLRVDAKLMRTGEFNVTTYLNTNRIQSTKGSKASGDIFYGKYVKGIMLHISESELDDMDDTSGVFCLVQNPVFRSTTNLFDMTVNNDLSSSEAEMMFYTPSQPFEDLTPYIQRSANEKVKARHAANCCSEVFSLQGISEDVLFRYTEHVCVVARDIALTNGIKRDICNGIIAEQLSDASFDFESIKPVIKQALDIKHLTLSKAIQKVQEGAVDRKMVFGDRDPSTSLFIGKQLDASASYACVVGMYSKNQQKLTDVLLLAAMNVHNGFEAKDSRLLSLLFKQ